MCVCVCVCVCVPALRSYQSPASSCQQRARCAARASSSVERVAVARVRRWASRVESSRIEPRAESGRARTSKRDEPKESKAGLSSLVSSFVFVVVPYVRPSSARRRRPLSLTWKPIKMAEIVQMFLFLYKSKYRRKRRRDVDDDDGGGGGRGGGGAWFDHNREQNCDRRWRCRCGHGSGGSGGNATATVPWASFLLWAALIYWVVHVSAAASTSSSSPTLDAGCDPDTCVNGICENGICVCREGWQGAHCQFCGGKVR